MNTHVTICLHQNTGIFRKTWPLVSFSLVFHFSTFRSYAQNKTVNHYLCVCNFIWSELNYRYKGYFFIFLEGGGYHLIDVEIPISRRHLLSDFFFSFHLKSYLHDANSTNTTLLTTLPTYNAYFIINCTAKNSQTLDRRYETTPEVLKSSAVRCGKASPKMRNVAKSNN